MYKRQIQAGADLVNDIWGLKYDPKMAAVIAKYDVACCLMHNKSNTEYQNFLIDKDFQRSLVLTAYSCLAHY